MTKATNVARVAAVVAGLGLVASSFASLAQAQTATATTTTTTTTSASFTRDLTMGSTGADVTALQTWLIAQGFSIPAGATGYFGAQTKAALASYQAAHSISPAAGYFGPITRAAVAAAGGSTTTTSTVPGCAAGALYSSTTGQACAGTTTTTTTTSTLSGGEASLRGYDLKAGDDLSEGDTDQEIAVADLDVRDGDVNVQRVTVEVTGGSAGSKLPWKYFDTLSVFANGKKIGDADVSSKSDWDKSGDTYSVDISTNGVMKEGDNQELSIRADAVSTIDSDDEDQVFALDIPDQGIRAVDGAGIQQYAGDDSDTVNVGFNGADSGDLTVRKSSDNPDAGVLVADDKDTSDDFDVLGFNIKNSDDNDVDFDTLTFNVSNTGGSAIKNIIRRATLDLDGDTYTGDLGTGSSTSGTIVFDDLDTSVGGNDSVDGTLSVELYGQENHYSTSGEVLTFSLAGDTSHVEAESADNGDTSDVSGSAQGNAQSISTNIGINVSGNNNSANVQTVGTNADASYGEFKLNFDVTANGDDVYIPQTVSASGSGTAGFDVVTSATSSQVTAATVDSDADTDSGYYIVHDGDTESFTITVDINPTGGNGGGSFQVGLDTIHFNDTPSTTGLQTLDVDATKSEFKTPSTFIPS